MMFDWNDQDQVGDTIWAEFGGGEDHIVPYPKGTEDDVSNNNNNSSSNDNNVYLDFGDADKKKINEEESDHLLSFPEQDTQKNNVDFRGCDVQNQTDLQSKLEMESWPDLPSLNGTLERDYSDGKDDDNMTSAYLNDFDTDSNLDKVQVQLEAQPDDFGSGQEGKSNSFLDCDWGNIGDFEDFDRLFSNEDSIFGTDMGGNGGEFLSQHSDVISNTVQSIPIPHLKFSGEEASGHGSSSAPSNDISSIGRIKKSHEKAESEKKIPKFRKKADEKAKSKTSQSTVTVLPPGSIQGSGMQTIPPPMVSQHLQVSPSNFVFPGYRYPGYTFPAMQVSPKSAANSGYKRSEKSEKVVSMTPQEKIEKLRRRQQMQAMLAIQQQQQQLGHQVLGNDNLVPQANSPKNQNQNPDSMASSAVIEGSENEALTSELNITRLQEECVGGSLVSANPHLEDTIYYQLQDALAKLDVRIRLCIRDSLLRLAQSAMERQSASDRSSTNFTSNPSEDNDSFSENDITNATKRCLPNGEGETGTNPIDRTVAQLLFHRLSDKSSSQVKEEAPMSPSSYNPDSKVSGSKSEEKPQNAGKMEQVEPAH